MDLENLMKIATVGKALLALGIDLTDMPEVASVPLETMVQGSRSVRSMVRAWNTLADAESEADARNLGPRQRTHFIEGYRFAKSEELRDARNSAMAHNPGSAAFISGVLDLPRSVANDAMDLGSALDAIAFLTGSEV